MSTMTLTRPMSEVTLGSPRTSVQPVVRQSVRPAGAPGQVRLTRRGRWVLVTMALLLLVAAGVAFGSGSAATERPGVAEPTHAVTVAPGDTLWEIAAAVPGDGEIRDTMIRIERLNSLEGGGLQVGQKLAVPTHR